MKRDFLEGLKIEPAVIDQIMTENGKDIEREKQKAEKAEQTAKDTMSQLETANKTMEKFKDYDQTKADVEKYKAEAEKIQKETAVKIATMERTSQVKDYLSNKKFINDITRDAIAGKLTEQLGGDEAKGKSIEDLFKAMTKDQKNILAEENAPTPPNVPSMAQQKSKGDENINAARAVMGLPPEK